MDQELELLAPVVNELGDYTPYGAAMKEQFPDLSDKAIAHLHYFGGLVKDDAGYEAHRLALRDKYGAMGLHQMMNADTLFKAQARTEEDLPPEIRDVPVEEDPEEAAEGPLTAAKEISGAILNDVRKLAPTQGNDLVEGVGLGVEGAFDDLDRLGEKLITATPENLKDDRAEGFFKLTPRTPEEVEWLNANAQPEKGEDRKFFFGLITKEAPDVPQFNFEAGVEGEYQMTHGIMRKFREKFPKNAAEYTGKHDANIHADLLEKMDKLDSFSGGIVKEMTEFAVLSGATGGGLGASGVAAAGISVAKPAVIDQIIFEENGSKVAAE